MRANAAERLSADGFAQLCLELDLPHERGKHQNHIRGGSDCPMAARAEVELRPNRIIVKSLSNIGTRVPRTLIFLRPLDAAFFVAI
ncbi:MAG: hypothetical protein DMF76_16275 [Acidobacteria bacterium]|nr:MAG: hypothetical protein DMF76_16275 [Acidobacteriota bacterium]